MPSQLLRISVDLISLTSKIYFQLTSRGETDGKAVKLHICWLKSPESCSHLKGNPGYQQIPQNQLQLRTPPGITDTHKDYPASLPHKRFKGGPPWNTHNTSSVQTFPLSCFPPLHFFLSFNLMQPDLPIVPTTGTVNRWKFSRTWWVRGKLVLEVKWRRGCKVEKLTICH